MRVRTACGLFLVVALLIPAASAVAQQSRVFVAPGISTGDLGGLTGADAICTRNAIAAKLGGGPWVAWLSTSTVDARDRLTPGSGPFVRASDTGTVIANDIADLTDGTLQNAILLAADGGLPLYPDTWTGTSSDGTEATTSNTCNDWTSSSSSFSGQAGSNTNTNSAWTDYGYGSCANEHQNLYCFEAPPAPVPAQSHLQLGLLALLLVGVGAVLIGHRLLSA